MNHLVNVTWPLPSLPASCIETRDRALAKAFLNALVAKPGEPRPPVKYNAEAEAAFGRLLNRSLPIFVLTSEGGR